MCVISHVCARLGLYILTEAGLQSRYSRLQQLQSAPVVLSLQFDQVKQQLSKLRLPTQQLEHVSRQRVLRAGQIRSPASVTWGQVRSGHRPACPEDSSGQGRSGHQPACPEGMTGQVTSPRVLKTGQVRVGQVRSPAIRVSRGQAGHRKKQNRSPAYHKNKKPRVESRRISRHENKAAARPSSQFCTTVLQHTEHIVRHCKHAVRALLRARPKAERVHRQLAEFFHIERPSPTVTLFRSLYLWNRAFDRRAVFFAG